MNVKVGINFDILLVKLTGRYLFLNNIYFGINENYKLRKMERSVERCILISLF